MSADYVTGCGQSLWNIHPESDDCAKHGCVIHNPTDPNKDWPTYWDHWSKRLWRLSPEGDLYHDKDVLSFERRRAEKWMRV